MLKNALFTILSITLLFFTFNVKKELLQFIYSLKQIWRYLEILQMNVCCFSLQVLFNSTCDPLKQAECSTTDSTGESQWNEPADRQYKQTSQRDAEKNKNSDEHSWRELLCSVPFRVIGDSQFSMVSN